MSEAEQLEFKRDYVSIAHDFALDAIQDTEGKRHNKWVRLAAQRHFDDLDKDDFAFYFDEWHAGHICDFAEEFHHIEGTWDTPTIHLEPAQIFILVTVFGWRRENGTRRFTTCYIEMARKGAKSTLTAIIALYCLTCEDEVGPQVIIGATTGQQAEKVFNPAKQMVKKQQDFREAFGVTAYAKSVVCETSGGFIQTINAKSETQDGWNPQCGILDELHAHKDRGLYDVIRSAFGARRNPMFWIITTAGFNVAGVCYEQHLLVKKILEKTVEAEHYFGIIFTLDEGDSELDPTKWIKANPLLGVTPTIESMEGYAAEAIASPDSMGEFKTKRCNIWTSAYNAWLNMELWKLGNTGPIDFNELRNVKCYGGLDLASTHDITAFVLAWMIGDRLKVRCRFWLPEDCVKGRTEKANVPYASWVEQGWLKTTPGPVTDYDYIEKEIMDSLDEFDINEIGYDRWNSSQLINNLLDKGAPMVELAQGAKTYNPPMKEVEQLVRSGKIDHEGNPALGWMASNIIARRDVNENMAPDRKNSMEKIDGMVALLMAVERLLFSPPPKKVSGGVIFV